MVKASLRKTQRQAAAASATGLETPGRVMSVSSGFVQKPTVNSVTPSVIHKHKKHKDHHRPKKEKRLLKQAAQNLLKNKLIKTENDFDPDGSVIKLEGSKPVVVSDVSRQALRKLLDHLLHLLQKKDEERFFAKPVNTATAPGYYQMIKEPMDFSTMKIKLHADKYSTLAAFRSDFEKICHNACSYNTADSVQYKCAQKLLVEGQRLLSQDWISSMTSLAPLLKKISKMELGFDANKPAGAISEDEENEDPPEIIQRPLPPPPQLAPQDLLNQAKAAARGAADRLRIYKAKSRMGFLRQRADGSTSLGFLTGGSGILSTNERPVSLGALIGRVKQGTGAIQGYREDRRNLCKAVYPLYYGAYSSHGPSYDSTFANLTKEETDLILNTSSEETADQLTQNVLNFTRGHDYTNFMGDHLLDILTENKHREETNYLQDKEALKAEEESLYSLPVMQPDLVQEPEVSTKVDFDSLRSLSEMGIDVSFLDSIQNQIEDQALESLTDTAALLEELKRVQLERLSAMLPTHLSQVLQPNEFEMELANQVLSNLAEMTAQVTPGDVVPHDSVRRALGMTIDIETPADPDAADEPSTSFPFEAVE